MRFLFNAMAPRDDEEGPALQGIPEAAYLDSGPIAKRGVFHTDWPDSVSLRSGDFVRNTRRCAGPPEEHCAVEPLQAQ